MVLIDKNVPISVSITPNGGRVMRMLVNNKVFSKYTRPSRAALMSQWETDLRLLRDAQSGNVSKIVKVHRV